MAWLESHTGILRQIPTLQLAADLQLSPVAAVGHLHVLWHAALEQQEDGDLSAWPDAMIAHAAAYPGEPSAFVAALQARQWLQGKVLHRWLEHAGLFLIRKYSTSNQAKLQQIWKVHGRTYGKKGVKTLPCVAKRKRTVSEQNVIAPSRSPHAAPSQADADTAWIANLRSNPAYQHVNFPVEFGKMDAWFSLGKNRQRKRTRRFVLNWLNKIEPPMALPLGGSRPTKVVL